MIVLTKKNKNKKDTDSFMFASSCTQRVHADYIEYRLIYAIEPLTLSFQILCKSIEIVEKSLKIFISIHKEKETSSWLQNDFGHNIEKLRKEAAEINPIFNDQEIKNFTLSLYEKTGHLYQYIRYGSHSCVDGMAANLKNILPVVDKVFFKSFLLLPEGPRGVLNFCSPIKFIVTNSNFDQSINKKLILECLKKDNNYIKEYINYCKKIQREHEEKIKYPKNAKIKQ